MSRAAGDNVFARRLRRFVWPLGLLALVGCLHPVAEQTDQTVSLLAARPLDLPPPSQVGQPVSASPATVKLTALRAAHQSEPERGTTPATSRGPHDSGTGQEPTLPPPRR